MSPKEISKSIILKYGLLLGAISVLMSVILYALDKHLEQNQAVGIISILFILAAIILGIKTFSKFGKLTFGEGLKIGIGIAVVGAIVITVYNYIFTSYIEPDFVNQLGEVQRKAMESSGELTTEQIDKRIEKLKEGANSFITPAIGIVFTAFLGFVFSAITTVIFIKINENKN
ncbi:DUF4199 domain-containing protein [Flavicella marina]|uniref:DUF4199 domain-containing protein n=1 Tax=Flavicella marina TaxID=1475951 RepID=UPI0012648743|nr:DUF4199 domain-containing protein [Flavicella marina]